MTNESFHHEEVTIQSDVILNGTLTMPNDVHADAPAILLIAGSGQTCRDGNTKKIQINIYKDLAEFFTRLGFVTLRYDKRGTYKSGGNFLEAGISDLIYDATCCVKFLKEHPLVDKDKVIIVGHSEGAILAPAVDKETNVAGLILLAGLAKPSKLVLEWQREMAYKEMNEATGIKGWLFRTFKVVDRAKQKNEQIFKKILASDLPVIRVQGMKINAKWMRETLNFDVREYLKEVTCPVLAITGDKDVQTPPDHALEIAEIVQGEAEGHIIPNMNHIFRKREGRHTMLHLMKEYKEQANEPIHPELFTILENWVKKHGFI